jgi:AcrR family transcriptional regulator
MARHTAKTLGRAAQATKRRIARKARKPFRATGWGVTRVQIAAAAGVSPASVIAYFPTLRSLVRETYAAEIAGLDTVIDDALRNMEKAATSGDRDRVFMSFVLDVADAFACRPVFAMAFLPYMPDPWTPRSSKAPAVQGTTSDTLTKAFTLLLKARWETIEGSYHLSKPGETAKHHMLALLGAAANKRTRDDIIIPICDHLL